MKSLWNFIFGLSLLAILVAAWFGFAPLKAQAKSTKPDDLATVTATRKTAEANLEDTRRAVTERVWDVTPEMFSSRALELLNGLAAHRAVKVTNFRSGRPLRAASLTEVPCVATLEGSFVNVMALIEDLESPDTKVAIGQLSISAIANSDQVTASVSLTGFLGPKEIQP